MDKSPTLRTPGKKGRGLLDSDQKQNKLKNKANIRIFEVDPLEVMQKLKIKKISFENFFL